MKVLSSNRLWPTVLAAFSLVAAAHCVMQSSGSVYRQEDVQCVPKDSPAAIARHNTQSETHCAILASETEPNGLVVAQFNQIARSCTIFFFQSICRSLIPSASTACVLFLRFPIDHRLLNSKLNNVWLGDEVGRLENLVGQADEDTNRLHPVNIEWSSEGAVFDGSTSHAVLNKSSISFATGLTWLMRIKRQPQVQPFIEFVDCNNLFNFSGYGIHMGENNSPGRLYARPNRITGTLLPKVRSPINSMPLDENQWLNIGYTASRASFNLFLGDAFVPHADLTLSTDGATCTVDNSNACLFLGMRFKPPDNPRFKGTVKAIAFASTNMSEAEIREFFALIEG